MARIQINDINPSDTELLFELSEQELLAINGGINWKKIGRGIVLIIEGIFEE